MLALIAMTWPYVSFDLIEYRFQAERNQILPLLLTLTFAIHRDAAFNLNLRLYLYLLRHMEHCCCNRFRLKRKPSTVFPARNKSGFWKLLAFRVSF
jgi:hypothetical protein